MALASAIAAAALVVAGLFEGSWLQDFTAGLAAAITTLAAYFVLLFLWNLLAAPKRIRREHRARVPPPNAFPGVGFSAKVHVRDTDRMQREAATIASLIRNHLERQERGIHGHPQGADWIQQRITYFGDLVENETWITRKSRKRSRMLYKQIASTEDFEEVQRLCLEFQELKPSH